MVLNKQAHKSFSLVMYVYVVTADAKLFFRHAVTENQSLTRDLKLEWILRAVSRKKHARG